MFSSFRDPGESDRVTDQHYAQIPSASEDAQIYEEVFVSDIENVGESHYDIEPQQIDFEQSAYAVN